MTVTYYHPIYLWYCPALYQCPSCTSDDTELDALRFAPLCDFSILWWWRRLQTKTQRKPLHALDQYELGRFEQWCSVEDTSWELNQESGPNGVERNIKSWKCKLISRVFISFMNLYNGKCLTVVTFYRLHFTRFLMRTFLIYVSKVTIGKQSHVRFMLLASIISHPRYSTLLIDTNVIIRHLLSSVPSLSPAPCPPHIDLPPHAPFKKIIIIPITSRRGCTSTFLIDRPTNVTHDFIDV